MILFIVALSGPKTGTKIRLSEGFTIGRKTGDLILDEDSKVSGIHAKVAIDNKGQFILNDQNSSNGLILNELKVKKIALLPGVIFTIGQTQFRVIKDSTAPELIDVQYFESPKIQEIPKTYEVPRPRAPQSWREKITEHWDQKEPMISNPIDEQTLSAFTPTLILDFIEGVQSDQKITLGYGPRQAGFDHLDIDLIDPTIPDEAFELRPGPGRIELLDLTHGQVFVNNRPCEMTFLEEGDIISVGQTKIKVRFL